MMKSLLFAVSIAIAIHAQAAFAFTIYTDEASFDADFPGLPVEDFEAGNAANGSFSACDAPLDASGDVPCGFAPGSILAGVAFQDDPGPNIRGLILLGAGTSLNPSRALVANTFADAFEIVFDPPVGAAGMMLHSTAAVGQGAPDTLAITVFDESDAVLGSDPAAAASGPGVFWGVSSPVPIARIHMLSTNTRSEGVDDVRFTAAVCGDGQIDAPEECDDGNTADGDCCSATCQIEPDGSTCDDGRSSTVDECMDGVCVGTRDGGGSVPGSVRATCQGLEATIVGTAGPDVIVGTPGDDVIQGKAGNDDIRGGDGDDVICGGRGDDVIRGGRGRDSILGGKGSDDLRGGPQDDLLQGGAHGDSLKGGKGTDVCLGGDGTDSFHESCETIEE